MKAGSEPMGDIRRYNPQKRYNSVAVALSGVTIELIESC